MKAPTRRTSARGLRRALFGQWEAALSAAALLVVFLAVVWGVVARYLAPQPAAWSNEVATLGFAWVVFLGAAAALRRRMHASVDALTRLLPDGVRRVIARCVALFVGVALIYAAWLAAHLALDSLGRPTPVLRLPYTVVYVAAVLGLISMALGFLGEAVWLREEQDD